MFIEEKELILLSRLKKNIDGIEFIDNILLPLQKENYNSMLKSGKSERDELVGYGRCIADLLELFEECDIRLAKIATQKTASLDTTPPSWS